ncbi:centrosomal protein of 68 kDa isoform X3 [Phycodurus eques]|uniref:centrosomal protein of 68 kDa isoform X3 n=1 Tax=Phycodurus eques TaxID=693459 RepID=UPI002ACD299F|nr:centrosomal protein of 68 kDa isoform X3 [Phycodurus eques]
MTFYPMDAVECSRPRKVHVPDTCIGHSIRLNAEDIASDKGATEGEEEQPPKCVTMAPTPRYLTDRQYVMRKPLFSIGQPSILKKTRQHHQLREMHVGVSRIDGQHSINNNLLTRLEEDPNQLSYRFTPSDVSSYSESKEVCGSPLGIPDVGSGLQHEETLVGSTLTRSKSIQCGLSGSILEFQKKDLPVRPQLTSTVLYPTYIPRSLSYAERDQTDLKKQNISSLAGKSRRKTMSYYEANYWDCAIPKPLPTSTNRYTGAWDPNKEYQALLDYTYPLRPGQMDSKWDSIELQGDTLQQQDMNLKDSGIELDNLCPTSLSGSDLNLSNTIKTKAWDRMDQKIDSTGLNSSTFGSTTVSNGLFLDCLDFMDKDVVNCPQGKSQRNHQYAQPSSIAFIHATSVLPQSQSASRDFDKEFWSLPDHLERNVLLLTGQVKDVTTRLNRPVTAICDAMDCTSIFSTISQPGKELAKEADAKQHESKRDDGSVTINKNKSAAESEADHGNSEAVRTSPSSWKKSVGAGLTQESFKEVETLVEQLCGLYLRDPQKVILEDQDRNCSLMQHTHMFCSLLEQYILWLYKVSDKLEMLARPTVYKDNMKRSLAEYQRFQREVSSHEHLTAHVLQTGELLLSCMDSTSPLLRNMLLLIERQSRAIENRTEHFVSSILSAMDVDSQTQPNQHSHPVQRDKLGEPWSRLSWS